ncbi:UNVERIFIED_CONTAM: hypothetical protein BJ099_110132 [Lysinibacillus xylanilyticus]
MNYTALAAEYLRKTYKTTRVASNLLAKELYESYKRKYSK